LPLGYHEENEFFRVADALDERRVVGLEGREQSLLAEIALRIDEEDAIGEEQQFTMIEEVELDDPIA
jgi:hypothetical protein